MINFFVRLEALLEHAEQLPNWKCEKQLLLGGDFSDFWSLNWQLQGTILFSNI